MTSYVLRRIDPELWRAFKARARGEGRSMRFVLIELMRIYAKWGYHVVETFDSQGKH